MTAGPPAREGDRRLAAVAFTDIVGYSAMVNRDDANAMRLVEEHFALVRRIAASFGGHVVKTIGDSVHLELTSAQAATACAIAIQQAHRQRNARVAQEQQFEIRIGVHVGDVEHRGGDIYGDGVNIAARLQPLAPVGGLAISDHVRNQLRLELRNRFTSRGLATLKNIDTPVELFVLEGDTLAGLEVAPTGRPVEAAPPARADGQRRRGPILVAAALVVVLLAVAAALVPQWRSNDQAATQEKSIAVLPFADMSPAKDQEYFSDGIAEDLLNLLSKIETLQVAARTSSFSFKGKDVPIPEVAKALRVANVLEGSVRRAGNQVRITARLVRAADGFEIWSQTWDRTLDDIFKVQDEIASAVVSELRVKLLGAEPTAKPVDPKFYPLILQAHALANKGSTEGDTQAIAVYQQVLASAPNEARAWSGMARAFLNRGLTGTETANDLAQAEAAADKALAIDPSDAQALAILGRIAMNFEFDLPKAARYYQRAHELEPGNLLVINSAATLLMNTGRCDEALPLYEYRVAHDAANAGAYVNLGNCLINLKRSDAALEAFRTASRLSPDYQGVHAVIATILLQEKHDLEAAMKEIEAETDDFPRALFQIEALQAQGRMAEADAALQAFIEQHGETSAALVASAYVTREAYDETFEWLEKSAAAREPILPQVLSDPTFEPLRDDPRWLPLLRKVGLAPEQVAKIELKITLPQHANP